MNTTNHILNNPVKSAGELTTKVFQNSLSKQPEMAKENFIEIPYNEYFVFL